MTEQEASPLRFWAVLELMGHRRLAGYLTEQEVAGAAFIRIDVPGDEGATATQFYAPAAVYCITPTTEEIARAVAKRDRPEPVSRWELPAPKAEARPLPDEDPDPYDDEDDDPDNGF